MSTRKRSRNMNELENTEEYQEKFARIDTLPPTNTNTDEHKTVTNAEAVHSNAMSNNSCDTQPDEYGEIDDQSSSSEDLTRDTELILREADVLIAEVEQFRREMNNTNDNGNNNGADSEATIILENVAEHQETNDQNQPIPSGSTTSNESISTVSSSQNTNNEIDDSVVFVDETDNAHIARPIVGHDDDEVIFVNESRRTFRTIATIDLCDTSDQFSPPRQPKDIPGPSAASSSSSSSAVANTSLNTSHNNLARSAKCPICLETYTFDKILSTMCGHLYCDSCIKNVIKTRKKCPMCNRALKPNQVHRIFLDV